MHEIRPKLPSRHASRGAAPVARALLLVAAAVVGSACSTPRLHRAVETGDLAEVNRLLDAGAAVDAREPNEDLTPLGWAVAIGSQDIAAALIARGADVNARSNEGFTPLHNAAWHNRLAMVELLLAKGADPSARTTRSGETPLHRAIARNGLFLSSPKEVVPGPRLEVMTDIAAQLIGRGADPNAMTSAGATPLHLAALTGHRPLVELLLNRGAVIDARGADGVTPLYMAAVGARLDVVEALLARGALVDARTKSGYTPLWHAARSGASKIASLLIARGADVNAKDVEGSTPLLAAVATAALASPASERPLASAGASAADRAELRMGLGTAQGLWHEVAMDLIAHGADVRAHPPRSGSALSLAAIIGDVELVGVLLDHGAVIDEVADGETALHAALAERQAKVATLLLERGASVQVVNRSKRTPLHFAAAYLDDESIVELLVARGADVNAVDAEGRTPLRYADKAKNRRAAEALRAHGAR